MVLRSSALVLLASVASFGQVVVKLTPEPMAVPLSQVSNAKSLGYWSLDGCNTGNEPVTLASQQIDLAVSTLSLIPTSDAALVLNSQAQKTLWGYIKQYGGLAAQGLAIALAVKNPGANVAWSTGLSIGAMVIPQIVDVARGQIPSPAPLLTQLQWPLTIPAKGCFSDHRFAAKVKNAKAQLVTIP